MKLDLNFFPLGIQIPQTSYCIFWKPVICTNVITCSAKLSLQLSVVYKFCNIVVIRLCLQFNSILYFNKVS